MTAGDVAASFNKIIFPVDGLLSARSSNYLMVEKVEALDPSTVVFKLKFATSAFLPALADPFNFIYSKAILDKERAAKVFNTQPRYVNIAIACPIR